MSIRSLALLALLMLVGCAPQLPPYVEPGISAAQPTALLQDSLRSGWWGIYRVSASVMPLTIDEKRIDRGSRSVEQGVRLLPGAHRIGVMVTRTAADWFFGYSHEGASFFIDAMFEAGHTYRLCMEPALGRDAHPFQATVWIERNGVRPSGPYVTVPLKRYQGALLMRAAEDAGVTATCR